MNIFKRLLIIVALLSTVSQLHAQALGRQIINFDKGWLFCFGDDDAAKNINYNERGWQPVDLPHDWSIYGAFSKNHPATPGGGALPGGKGRYRKSFHVPVSDRGKSVFIDFDGVYRNSRVWLNGHLLGFRPNGYTAFRYDLTPYLRYGGTNVLSVSVDNSDQPNSRWYSGSGIYRSVNLIKTGNVHVDLWGTYVKIDTVSSEEAKIRLQVKLVNTSGRTESVRIEHRVLDINRTLVTAVAVETDVSDSLQLDKSFVVKNPKLWSDVDPYLYTIETRIFKENRLIDTYSTPLGIRTFVFDRIKGFFLNGRSMKIRGVCIHHDLGALGVAFNVRAAERQLQLLKRMGCNAIRTSHNPPAEAFLNLCDRMGFLVMDETFDMWKGQKNKYDYSLDWDKWHVRDLKDHIKRDRNHPSVIVWSIGNEIPEQWGSGKDTTGRAIVRELTAIVKALDDRPVTSATNFIDTNNNLIKPGVYDLIGYNYNHDKYATFPEMFPGKSFIATETVSALQTRGSYDMPSDSIRIWPLAWDKPFYDGNTDLSCSSYDNCRTPWGSTHETTLRVFNANQFVSGMFVWTGFDYLGEPTPYPWPARSSYFGIMDLAGFPKDVYYLYQSQWTDKPVLHIFPHWNWSRGKTVDVWAYFSQADEVELYLNGKSLGRRTMPDSAYHVMWRVPFAPGTLKAVSRRAGRVVLTRTISTAGKPARIRLEADISKINADGKDLSFITVKVEDEKGNVVPYATSLINFSIRGKARIVGVDNGNPTSMESFKKPYRKAFHGLALAIIQSGEQKGTATLVAQAAGLRSDQLVLTLK